MSLTREQLLHGKKLLEESFLCPWYYKQYEIECGTCAGGTTSVCNGKEYVECPNPECDGSHVPCTFVESPKEYPDGQVVATIDVPGFSDLAEKNGECICWLRNNATTLIDAYEELLILTAALTWLSQRDGVLIPARTAAPIASVIAYAESLGWSKEQQP